MSVYTVHEPPMRAADASVEPQRFVFVRDGFYLWAFLLAPLWMVWHRQWLVLAVYVVGSVVIDVALRWLGGSATVIALVGILIALLIGLEAATLRRFTFKRRGWRDIGIVGGDRLKDAERRFFDSWVRQAAAPDGTTTKAKPDRAPVAPAQALSEASGVIGLFPEPGVSR
jgi:hypothetical protein